MSKKSAAELFRAAFFGDGDESDRERQSREESRRAREETDRITRKSWRENDRAYAAARRQLRDLDEDVKRRLQPSDEIDDEEIAAARALGHSEDTDLDGYLKRYLTHRESRKAAERRKLGLDPHARPAEYRPPANPHSHGFKGKAPDDMKTEPHPGYTASRSGEEVVTLDDADAMPLVPDPASPTKGLSPEAFQVAQLCGEDPLRLARYIAAKGAVRFAAAAVDE